MATSHSTASGVVRSTAARTADFILPPMVRSPDAGHIPDARQPCSRRSLWRVLPKFSVVEMGSYGIELIAVGAIWVRIAPLLSLIQIAGTNS